MFADSVGIKQVEDLLFFAFNVIDKGLKYLF